MNNAFKYCLSKVVYLYTIAVANLEPAVLSQLSEIVRCGSAK